MFWMCDDSKLRDMPRDGDSFTAAVFVITHTEKLALIQHKGNVILVAVKVKRKGMKERRKIDGGTL